MMQVRNVSTASHASALRTRRNVRREQLIVMVCGSPGTGKTTLINNLAGERIFNTIGAPQAASAASEAMAAPKIEIVNQTVALDDDDGTRIAFTAVDVANFGAATDNSPDADEIVTYIEQKYDEVLAEESRIRRNPRFHDARVHACVYLVFPSTRGLSALDVATLRKLGPLVNVILAIGRSDSLTAKERTLAKQALMRDVELHQLQIFRFKDDDISSGNSDHEESRTASIGGLSQLSDANGPSTDEMDQEVARIRAAMPFAIVCSSDYDESRLTPRATCNLPHGEVAVLNEDCSDLGMLRDAILYVFRSALVDNTKDNLYELYRTRKLTDGRTTSVQNAASAATAAANGSVTSSAGTDSINLQTKDYNRGSVLDAEELALHANRIREEQLRREAELLREQERRVHEEIDAQRAALEARERELKELEEQLRARKAGAAAQQSSVTSSIPEVNEQVSLPQPPDLPQRSSSRSPSSSLPGNSPKPSTPTNNAHMSVDTLEDFDYAELPTPEVSAPVSRETENDGLQDAASEVTPSEGSAKTGPKIARK